MRGQTVKSCSGTKGEMPPHRLSERVYAHSSFPLCFLISQASVNALQTCDFYGMTPLKEEES